MPKILHYIHHLLFELPTPKIYEMFVYKHTETIEYVKKQPTFKEKYKLHEWITWELLGLRMGNVQGIVFIWTRTYSEIFKSALMYL